MNALGYFKNEEIAMTSIVFLERRLWTHEAGLTALLICILLFFIALYPLGEVPYGTFLADIFFSLILISGVMTVFHQRSVRLVGLGLALAVLVLHWVGQLYPHESWAPYKAILGVAFCWLLIVVILRQVFKEGAITYHRICGAIAAYLLIGVSWGFLYLFVALHLPGAFHLPPWADPHKPQILQQSYIYFSFVTLTTLGYGDIVAVHPSVRLLVMLEAILGQLYPAITLAWLVAMEIISRTRK
jgi:hypothetical protein